MDANDNAPCLNERGDWTFFASKLAPTGLGVIQVPSVNPFAGSGSAVL